MTHRMANDRILLAPFLLVLFAFPVLLDPEAAALTEEEMDDRYFEAFTEYLHEDNEAALSALRPLAEAGHAKAQELLGTMLKGGDGTAADPAAAFGWFLKAARQGRVQAQFEVGRMLVAGQGVVHKDPKQAVAWLEKAAARNHPHALFALSLAHAGAPEFGIEADDQQALRHGFKAAYHEKNSPAPGSSVFLLMGLGYAAGPSTDRRLQLGTTLIRYAAGRGDWVASDEVRTRNLTPIETGGLTDELIEQFAIGTWTATPAAHFDVDETATIVWAFRRDRTLEMRIDGKSALPPLSPPDARHTWRIEKGKVHIVNPNATGSEHDIVSDLIIPAEDDLGFMVSVQGIPRVMTRQTQDGPASQSHPRSD